MIEDSDGEVWIATSGEGLYRFLHLIKSGLEYTGIFPERLIASPKTLS